MASIPFDRVADTYDVTRGGMERARDLVGVMAGGLRPGPVLEVGVGTGVVAAALGEIGHPVLGIDLSVPMLRRAQDRVGARVALGDGYRLPVRDRAVPNAALVWVLQLVPDVPVFLAEAARTVVPGGRIVAIPAGGDWAPDDMSATLDGMILTLRPPQDRPEQIEAAARDLGLRVVARTATAPRSQHDTPEDLAMMIERRVWSMLWDLDDRTWARVVEPTLAALRSLPDPGRPRARASWHPVVVLELP
jgi:ubiquinone/menaquinone biosynthesis C-methylase UbiE